MSATVPLIPMRPYEITLDRPTGRVLTDAKFENMEDAYKVERGELSIEECRSVEVKDALVDTGCTVIGLPRSIIEKLGLTPLYRRPVRGATGNGETTVYGTVRLTIQGRYCSSDVFEVPDEIPVLIGQIPLEQLDFVVDMATHQIIGNPRHGGDHIIEAY